MIEEIRCPRCHVTIPADKLAMPDRCRDRACPTWHAGRRIGAGSNRINRQAGDRREQIEQGQAGRTAMTERAWQQDRRIEALEAALREIAVPLHNLSGNATLMREIARKALAEPLGCPTPGGHTKTAPMNKIVRKKR